MNHMPFSRRVFIQSVAATAGAAAIARVADGADESSNQKLILSAPLTHSDWMLKRGIEWGHDGVRHMLDACKKCGWSRIHWRVLDGGRRIYPTHVLRPSFKVEPDSIWNPQTPSEKALYKRFFSDVSEERRKQILADQQRHDYATFDPLAEAIGYGHQIGLAIDAWITINEDDHGWGLISDFARKHQQFAWRKRDGTPYHSQMSFAFPEVREYKLAILDDVLNHYDVDGIFLDWIRTGDIRDNPQTDSKGVANRGYESLNIAAFKAHYGIDPHDVPNDDRRWIRLRAEPQTLFMRSVRQRLNLHRRHIPLSVLVGHPWHYRGLMDPIDGNLRGLLLDVKTWANKALIDAAVAAGYYRPGGDAGKALQALRAETNDKVNIWYYAWVPQTPEEFTREFDAARRLGAKQMLLWEADYIDDRPNAAALRRAMSAKAKR